MRSRKILTILLAGFGLSVMVSCAAKTTLTGWRAPEYTGGPFFHLLVIGCFHSDYQREKAERMVVDALEKEACRAAASVDYLRSDRKLSKAELGRILHTNGFDGVLYMKILKVDKDYRYYSPTSSFPFNYDPDWYPYYDDGFESMSTGGYLRTSETVYIESSLFSCATGRIVWVGQSSTTDVVSISEVAPSLGTCIAQDLVSKGLIL